jgi:hypothetical protein
MKQIRNLSVIQKNSQIIISVASKAEISGEIGKKLNRRNPMANRVLEDA